MKILNLKQGSPEWTLWRQQRIGASDTPVILGVSPYKTKRQLMSEKLGKSQSAVSFNMRAGNDLEPEIRKAFEAKTGIDLMPVCADSDDHPFMAASYDGLNFEGDTFVELKLNNAENHALAKSGSLFEPHHFQTQKQWFIGRKKFKRGYYASYNNNDLAIVEIEPIKEDWFKIIEEETKFWEMLQKGELPELTEEDFVSIDEQDVYEMAENVYIAAQNRKEWEEKESNLKKALIERVGHKAQIGNYTLNKSERKGAVQYDKIDLLRNVDLEKYRKAPSTVWSLTKK